MQKDILNASDEKKAKVKRDFLNAFIGYVLGGLISFVAVFSLMGMSVFSDSLLFVGVAFYLLLHGCGIYYFAYRRGGDRFLAWCLFFEVCSLGAFDSAFQDGTTALLFLFRLAYAIPFIVFARRFLKQNRAEKYYKFDGFSERVSQAKKAWEKWTLVQVVALFLLSLFALYSRPEQVGGLLGMTCVVVLWFYFIYCRAIQKNGTALLGFNLIGLLVSLPVALALTMAQSPMQGAVIVLTSIFSASVTYTLLQYNKAAKYYKAEKAAPPELPVQS